MWLLSTLFLFLIHFFSLQRRVLCISASRPDLSNESLPDFDVQELSRSLFSYRDDPLADADRWSALSDAARKRWTATHQVFDFSAGFQDVMRVTSNLTGHSMTVHLEVQIVAPDKLISQNDWSQIETYASAMRPEHHGTLLEVKITMAPQTVYKRLVMFSPSQNSEAFTGYLEQVASASGSSNILFVIMDQRDESSGSESGLTPHVGTGRTGWTYIYFTEETFDLAELLRSIELTAERLFNPVPMHYPLSIAQSLKVELVAYTPGHDHRAQWLEGFAWDHFEDTLRGMAVHGQKLRFSSIQANADCTLCAQAFQGIRNPPRNFIRKAAAVLGEGAVSGELPNKRFVERTLRLYVVDTYMLPHGKALERIERDPLYVFPSMAIITLRSPNKSTVASLPVLLSRAFLACTYGIGSPELYLMTADRQSQPQIEREPSVVVLDIFTRNLVRSITEQRIAEVTDIVRGILYFDIDPAKSLGAREYLRFCQRLNLLLYKLLQARKLVVRSSDSQAGLYMAVSTYHDMNSLWGAFDIETESKTLEKFRDPTLRCHFSRLKRETLRASRILESRHPNERHMVFAVGSLCGTAILWWLLLERRSKHKGQHKLE